MGITHVNVGLVEVERRRQTKTTSQHQQKLQEIESPGEYKTMPFNLKGRNVLITGASRYTA